jgi:uncharacterized membrane protein
MKKKQMILIVVVYMVSMIYLIHFFTVSNKEKVNKQLSNITSISNRIDSVIIESVGIKNTVDSLKREIIK